ncbi:MAG TPA: TldD/PmbA family protein [Anaeromyxobacteraceae bacterium]|nr:TldD/PmbA family protein [Anaeromyxobacteraceae bacterium]
MRADLKEIARAAVAVAQRAGAQQAAAGAHRSRQVDVEWRDGRIENVTEATTRGVGVELYVDGRYSAVSTSDLRPEAVERFIRDAVALAGTLAPDPCRALPGPDLYRGQAPVDLQLEDPGYGQLETAERRRLAEAAEAGAREAPGAEAILSVTTSFGDSFNESWRVHSDGFEGWRRSTDFRVSAGVTVKDRDGRRPEDWDWAGTRHFCDLPVPGIVGRRAAERALGRLGARKGESAVMPMVVEARAAGRLVAALLAPLAASALQQKRSFFEGKLGQKIGSELLDLADDPLVPKGLGSRLFDGEGIAAKRFALFERGVARHCYVDAYYGRKLGMAPTTGRSSNLAWTLGSKDAAGLFSEMGEGIAVSGFLGGNSNGTTGDFSLGLQGFRVRQGRVAEPVGEMNVSGNHLELWSRLAMVGTDPYPYSPLRTPTLLFDRVEVAGL